MAFVRKKKVYDHEYYQLVESYRENGKMRQRVLAHLGHADTLEAAIENTTKELEETRSKQRALREEREGILSELDEQLPNIMSFHNGIPPRYGYGEFLSADTYGRIEYECPPYRSYGGGFPTYESQFKRPLSTNFGRPWPYEGYWGFVGVCGRFWRISGKIKELETRKERVEERLEKLKAARR